ncbi:glycosyltransferase family 2 protein [Cryobacterium sp. N21]|uniref:glycosyltransferase family 2 protein n=1 Tax=Cryobacterium sp. N21 TaxID=2048289 RepID=UPI000CE40B50|nr:glycosyltransferase family 2 protein [Cryobacterium sp. N21]
MNDFSLSVVIPSYNSAPWLPSTLAALAAALLHTAWTVEIIVVDDGSTDDSGTVLREIQAAYPFPLRIVAQPNQGRFLARWAGTQAARYENILIVDSRVLVHERAFEHVALGLRGDDAAKVWNGHMVTDRAAPLVGLFWEVPTYAFWGDYLSHPRPTVITVENLDRVPKGTTFLLLPKELFVRACLASWPEGNAHLVSDDTKLLRFMVTQMPIRLDPGFSATYRPRTTIKQFLSHSWVRGTLFVDSYAGTSALRSLMLIALVVLPPVTVALAVVAIVTGIWSLFFVLIALAFASLLAPAFVGTLRRCPPRATMSYLTFVLPFGVVFWAGLTRGLVIHRGAFLHTPHSEEKARS